MKVLVVGKGGREHALVWKIRQSPLVDQVFCAPGNAGIGQIARLVSVSASDIFCLLDFAMKERVDLTVVGPEEPLAEGIVDIFRAKGLKIVGPTAAAARIEASKVFAKETMARLGIPTADFMAFGKEEARKAIQYALSDLPCVVKADGLAAGKGVVVCHTKEEVIGAIDRFMLRRVLGEAGETIVIEEFLRGQEATLQFLTDGRDVIPLLPSQDHKQLFDEDVGPNTGGMGAVAPTPAVTPEIEREIMGAVVYPLLKALRTEERLYSGVLYVGIMITPEGPKVLEFNCRFGDPEWQTLAVMMKSDIVPLLLSVAEGRLGQQTIEWEQGVAICVVMTSSGYPGSPKIGKEITGLDRVARMGDVRVFHAATKRKRQGVWVTDGGRVLNIVARGPNAFAAKELADKAVAMISWKGEHHRSDIGEKVLRWGFQPSFGI